MIKLSVAAGVPLIAVTTRDILNFPAVVEAHTGKTPTRIDPANSSQMTSFAKPETKQKLYWMVPNARIEYDYAELYQKMVGISGSLIVVNARDVIEPMFNAGEAPIPQKLTVSFLKNIIADDKRATDLAQVLGGCTIKETAELVRLTMARDASLTPNGLMQTRRSIFQPGKGLTPTDTVQAYYGAPTGLSAWVAREKPFFLNAADPRLMPRGLLMNGPPGTGKTAGAKWIASQLGVPLFRVDVAGSKGRFVGDSETTLALNLARVDMEEPCVALIDEVEKIFGQEHADGGTSAGMLSQMLWWLAEHKSRVLTVMTTNNDKILPKELYREGRIDEVMTFLGVPKGGERQSFVENVLRTFKETKGWTGSSMKMAINAILTAAGDAEFVPQARLTELVYRHMKVQGLSS